MAWSVSHFKAGVEFLRRGGLGGFHQGWEGEVVVCLVG